MKNYLILGIVCLTVFISACTTTEKREWITVEGGKADATVILEIFLRPKFGVVEPSATWDIEQANGEADHRCKSWGYTGAELFKDKLPVQEICQQMPSGMSTCGQKLYRVVYQCLTGR